MRSVAYLYTAWKIYVDHKQGSKAQIHKIGAEIVPQLLYFMSNAPFQIHPYYHLKIDAITYIESDRPREVVQAKNLILCVKALTLLDIICSDWNIDVINLKHMLFCFKLWFI